eukprot:10130545-Ditylum_brightwellii.AAC.1
MECMLSAECTCAKSAKGYAWSLKLLKADKVVQHWKTRKLAILNNTDFDHRFCLVRLFELEGDSSLSFDDIQSRLTAARKHLKE